MESITQDWCSEKRRLRRYGSGGGNQWEQIRRERISGKYEQHTFNGAVWLAAWLFTIGFLHLTFWKAVFAIVVWPYCLGAHFSPLAR